MGDVQLPANFLQEFRDLKNEVAALRKRAPLTNSAISSGGLLIQDGGNVVIKGGGSLLIEDAAGHILGQLGLGPDGKYGLVVNDSSGNPQIRAGELESGGYGLEAVDASGNPVQLATLAFGVQAALVLASEGSSTLGSFVDLTTVGPSVSVLIGPSGRALVTMTMLMTTPGAASSSNMAFAVSGATTLAPNAQPGTFLQFGTNAAQVINPTVSGTFLVTGLTAGTNVFTAKYLVDNAGTRIGNRILIVQPF